MKKSVLALVLILLIMIIPSLASAHPKNDIIMETTASSVFVAYGSGIGSQSGYVLCSAFSDTVAYYTQTIKMELQKYSGGSWVTVTSWQESQYTFSMEMHQHYSATSGQYRVKSIHTAAGESRTSYSSTMNF